MGRRYDVMRHAAFHKKGEDWRNLIIGWEITRAVAPWVFAALMLGGLGFALYTAWGAITGTPDTDDATIPVTAAHTVGAVPGWLWFAAVVAALAVFGLWRPGRIVVGNARPARVAITVVIVLAMVGLFAVTLGMTTG